MTLLSVRALWRDKEIKGVHPGPSIFFLCWGIWNLIYYPSLDQYLSFWAGVFLTSTNLLWLGLLVHLTIRKNRHGHPPSSV